MISVEYSQIFSSVNSYSVFIILLASYIYLYKERKRLMKNF